MWCSILLFYNVFYNKFLQSEGLDNINYYVGETNKMYMYIHT